ncbi:MAG: ATP-dependent helicase [Nanoarchaeota archaeon]|nr:ATP-dependent helicase [Nanoarchaeota archaeon]
MTYTKSQQNVINFDEGFLQVIACAGSGKTDTITRRIARLLAEGVLPGSMVAFTFTDKAAEEMKFRIRKHLLEMRPTNPELGDMYVGTIHSFCFELLKDHFPKYKNYDVLDEHTRVLFLHEYSNFHKIGLHHLDKRSYKKVSKFCFNVDIVREEMLDTDKLPADFKNAYEKYIDLLEEKKFLDFSGMMYSVLRLLEDDKEFRKRVQEKYRYITVDEYQDINPIQEKIIALMTSPECNLCVVGDDDQCIYQWRGTDVKNILTFEKRYKKRRVHKEDITINFRSSKALVNSAKRVIERNPNRLKKDIATWDKGQIKSEKGDIYKVFFPRWQDEVNWIIDKIEELRGKRYVNNKGEESSLDYRDVAIFLRSVKTSAGPLIDSLKARGIKVIVKGGGRLFEAPEVDLILMSLHYLAGMRYQPPYSDWRDPAIEVTPEMLSARYAQVFGADGNKEFFLQELEDKRDSLDQDDFISLQELFHLVVMYMGATSREFEETIMYNLGRFSQLISDFENIYGLSVKFKNIKYFFGYVKGYAELNYDEGGTDDPTKINAVKIMTIHSVKGLQFPIVFVSDLIDGRFPSKGHHEDPWYIPREIIKDFERYEGTDEDERRLFYVAITRSEKFLFLTGSEFVPSKATNPRQRQPSMFFDEFPNDYAILDPKTPDPTTRPSLPLECTAPLRGFPTSYSELRYFDWCPHDYQLRYIYGFNPKVDMALGYGRSVHNILNTIHTKFKNRPPSSDEVLEIVDENFFLRYAPPKFQQRFREAAERIVTNYAQKFGGDFSRILETEKSFEFVLGEALIAGSIDLIKKIDADGNLQGIEIVDFKNRKKDDMATDYEKQLKLYAIASLRTLGLDPKKAVVHHLDDNSLSDVDISPSALKQMEEEVRRAVDDILHRRFSKTKDGDKCRKCDMQRICPK